MKPGQRLRLVLKRLHTGGLSWRKIGKCIGKSGGATWLIAHRKTNPDDGTAEQIMALLPERLFWNGSDELDSLVLYLLNERGRLTGRQLGRLCGTTDRTIRNSIKRLRDDRHDIGASMRPPRGYFISLTLTPRE